MDSSGTVTVYGPTIASATLRASAIASTTVAGPRFASPMTNTFFSLVSSVDGFANTAPRSVSVMPLSTKSFATIFSPIEEIKSEQGSETSSSVSTEERRPLASGLPSTHFLQTSLPSLSATGLSNSQNSTPSSNASCSSSSSAGI
ncbi:hypothetical protein SDC9_195730 [bioreactor metagenome]|uniref:Uncharacterized protein n=1 Tax=bioreactor metagenome TaxID=1076179 RepID=A0A645I9U8_9ZZZZ